MTTATYVRARVNILECSILDPHRTARYAYTRGKVQYPMAIPVLDISWVQLRTLGPEQPRLFSLLSSEATPFLARCAQMSFIFDASTSLFYFIQVNVSRSSQYSILPKFH